MTRAADAGSAAVVLADSDPGDLVDAAWMVAARWAAIDHVLTQTAVSVQTRQAYRAIALEQRPLKEVAASFGLSYAAVKQIKSRLDRAVDAVLAKLR